MDEKMIIDRLRRVIYSCMLGSPKCECPLLMKMTLSDEHICSCSREVDLTKGQGNCQKQ